jgi:AcrR family transcriptional regulator
MSKSGLYAHFGSKEELQLATIDTGEPDLRARGDRSGRDEKGVARLEGLGEMFLSYVDRQVFPGGCFFAAAQAEFDTHSGPVREKLAEAHRSWLGYLERRSARRRRRGRYRPTRTPAQLVFELMAMLAMANSVFVLQGDHEALDRAWRGYRSRLALASTRP